MAHDWRFFRYGGFDQVSLDRIEDWEALPELDQKLWAALACPVRDLEFDARTLAFIDTDQDGRIRAPELLAAVQWALSCLKERRVLLDGDALPLSAIDDAGEHGRKLLTAARELAPRLGKAGATELTTADLEDLAVVFPPGQPNGDGIIPVELAATDAQASAIRDILACTGSEKDRSGEPGVNEHLIRQFFADLAIVTGWQAAADLSPLGEATPPAFDALQAVEAKIDDFFVRTRIAGFDGRATPAMNGSDADFAALGAQLLSVDNDAARRLPLALVSPDHRLPLDRGLNPAWLGAMQAFRQFVVIPLLGMDTHSLDLAQWEDLKARFAGYRAWLSARPTVPQVDLPAERLRELAEDGLMDELLDQIRLDLSVAEAADSLVDLDRLVRYQRYLRVLLNNFVNLADFYTRRAKAIFQAGTLYIDGRSCDLCIQVHDAGKHAAMAGLSGSYLIYCDCVRKESPERMTVVAALTAGEAGKLMVGRNGVFYDREGRDWDATVVKLVENAISVREAFWSPYRKVSRLISNQIQKFASDREKDIDNRASQQVTLKVTQVKSAADEAQAAKEAPKPAQTPFDAARFAGIFAALGLALGALGTAIASVVTGFLALEWWQMPIALAGLLLMISGPSMVIAWFKLRQRNLAPILDANGWAVNTQAKLTIAFGTTLTALAVLPKGSQRSLTDPYA